MCCVAFKRMEGASMTDDLNFCVSIVCDVHVWRQSVFTGFDGGSLQRLNNINQRNTTLCTGPKHFCYLWRCDRCYVNSTVRLPYPHSGLTLSGMATVKLGLIEQESWSHLRTLALATQDVTARAMSSGRSSPLATSV